MGNELYGDFLKYVTILDNIDAAAERNEELRFTPEEREAVRRVQVAAGNNEEIGELLKKIKECDAADRLRIVEEHFNKKEKPKNEEEEIAKVYGVDPRNIQSKTLDNGKVVFSFYDFKLARLVVLENNKDGKSLTEYLEELQKEKEEYQSDNDLSNAANIMDDQRKKTSMELEMIPINEIGDHRAEIESLSKEDQEKVDFLIMHAEQLHVKSINLENMIYIDIDNNIKELVFDKENNVRVAEPEGGEFEQVEETVGPEVIGLGVAAGAVSAVSDSNPDELSSMFDEPKEIDRKGDVLEMIDETMQQQETGEKAKVLTKTDNNPIAPSTTEPAGIDESGFVNNVIFVLLMASVFVGLIVEIIYFM